MVLITKILIRSFCKKARKFILLLGEVTLELLKIWVVGVKVLFRFFRFENSIPIFLISIPLVIPTIIFIDYISGNVEIKTKPREKIIDTDLKKVFDKKPIINRKEYIKRKIRNGEII